MKYFLAVVLLPLFGLSGFSQNLYDFENSAAFANYLRQTNQFDLAIPEYERLVFMKPGDLSLQKNLLAVYWEADLWDVGINRASSLYPNENQLPGELAFEYLALLFKNQQFNKAIDFSENNTNLKESERFFYSGTTYAINYEWKPAYEAYSHLEGSNFQSAQEYITITRQALDEKEKAQVSQPLCPQLYQVQANYTPETGKMAW
ncbi:hypothetical protein [Cyclobacterium qasimii]|uniref:Uncharacterized protein n=1 Tax=Cyclobacterium qasimii M12-11B TaxID=641524 RepID=S7WP50_9BACT|nr:hypothetical protein [Cyclobacterium qasimii]EPR65928.1 hypothetical protein ADICYQ_5073 [Cyclobacterium qasimii M12-11B]